MRLNRKLQKALALAAVVTMSATAVPVVTHAKDYSSHWAKAEIEKWSANGILEGYEDGTFKPSNEVTRGELATIIVRVFGLTYSKGATEYTDVATEKWYSDEVAKVSAAGIMNDYEDGTFRPEAPATREEAAYAVAKAYSIAKADKSIHFSDQAEISDWASNEVLALATADYIQGNPDGSFAPQKSLTRAEVVCMIDKITAELFNKAGTYKKDIEGNVVINSKDVVLEDMTITGNLYIAEGVGSGDVTLNNVTLNGDIIVEGGGENSVILKGRTKVNNIIIDKAGDQPVRVLTEMLSEVLNTVVFKTNAKLEAQGTTYNQIIIDGATAPEIAGTAKVKELTVAKPAAITFVDGPVIEKLVVAKEATDTKVKGRGKKAEIKSAVIEADGMKFDKTVDVNKDKIEVADTVTVKPSFPSSGGGGGGGSSSGGVVTDKPITLKHATVTLVETETRELVDLSTNAINVEVDAKAGTVKVNGTTFTKDQTIAAISVAEANNIAELTVGLSDKIEHTFETGKEYTLADAKEALEGKRAQLMSILAGFEKELTPAQYNRAVELVTEAIDRVVNGTETVVNIGSVLEKAEQVKAKLNDPDVVAVLDKVESALKTLGVEVTGLGTDNITVSAKLYLKATSAHEMDTINVSVTYK